MCTVSFQNLVPIKSIMSYAPTYQTPYAPTYAAQSQAVQGYQNTYPYGSLYGRGGYNSVFGLGGAIGEINAIPYGRYTTSRYARPTGYGTMTNAGFGYAGNAVVCWFPYTTILPFLFSKFLPT